jgi:hypothetical protein
MKRGSRGERLMLVALPWLASLVIRLLRRLIRVEFVGEERVRALWSMGENIIFPFWHDQLLLMVKGYRGPGAKMLISASRDGELIARTMGYFGLGTIRGSSSRGGRQAFRELLAATGEAVDIGITPDGPKGPRHQVKEGVAQLARLSGRAVVPIAFACSRGHRFASWDRFLLPFPGCRGVYAFGEALRYREGESSADFRERIQQAMEENDRRAQSRLEERGVSAV